MRALEENAKMLAERGWWLQVSCAVDGRWSWCAGDNSADMTGGNGYTNSPMGCMAQVRDRLDEGRFIDRTKAST